MLRIEVGGLRVEEGAGGKRSHCKARDERREEDIAASSVGVGVESSRCL